MTLSSDKSEPASGDTKKVLRLYYDSSAIDGIEFSQDPTTGAITIAPLGAGDDLDIVFGGKGTGSPKVGAEIVENQGNKGQADGYASLDSGGLVPDAELASSGTADGTTFLRGDRTWAAASGGGVADGDKGDVTVSSSGTVWTIDSAVVTLAKMADLAQDQFIGRTTASTGVPETATITAAARTVLDDATVAAMVDTLGGASSTGAGGLVRADTPTIDTPSLNQPDIADFTSAQHDHSGTTNGGRISSAGITVSATDKLIGRSTAGSGASEEITCTAAGRALLDDADAAAQRTTLGLGTSATQSGWTYVILGSDFTTSSATAVNVTGLSFTPSASKTYEIEGKLLMRTATAATGARPGVSPPTGMTDMTWSMRCPQSATAEALRFQGGTATNVAASTGLPTTTDSYLAVLDALIVTGGSPSGAFQIVLLSETGGTNVTVRAQSFIRYREVS